MHLHCGGLFSSPSSSRISNRNSKTQNLYKKIEKEEFGIWDFLYQYEFPGSPEWLWSCFYQRAFYTAAVNLYFLATLICPENEDLIKPIKHLISEYVNLQDRNDDRKASIQSELTEILKKLQEIKSINRVPEIQTLCMIYYFNQIAASLDLKMYCGKKENKDTQNTTFKAYEFKKNGVDKAHQKLYRYVALVQWSITIGFLYSVVTFKYDYHHINPMWVLFILMFVINLSLLTQTTYQLIEALPIIKQSLFLPYRLYRKKVKTLPCLKKHALVLGNTLIVWIFFILSVSTIFCFLIIGIELLINCFTQLHQYFFHHSPYSGSQSNYPLTTLLLLAEVLVFVCIFYVFFTSCLITVYNEIKRLVEHMTDQDEVSLKKHRILKISFFIMIAALASISSYQNFYKQIYELFGGNLPKAFHLPISGKYTHVFISIVVNLAVIFNMTLNYFNIWATLSIIESFLSRVKEMKKHFFTDKCRCNKNISHSRRQKLRSFAHLVYFVKLIFFFCIACVSTVGQIISAFNPSLIFALQLLFFVGRQWNGNLDIITLTMTSFGFNAKETLDYAKSSQPVIIEDREQLAHYSR